MIDERRRRESCVPKAAEKPRGRHGTRVYGEKASRTKVGKQRTTGSARKVDDLACVSVSTTSLRPDRIYSRDQRMIDWSAASDRYSTFVRPAFYTRKNDPRLERQVTVPSHERRNCGQHCDEYRILKFRSLSILISLCHLFYRLLCMLYNFLSFFTGLSFPRS